MPAGSQAVYRGCADMLGLTGAWQEIGRKGILDRKVLLPQGYYCLFWGERHQAILWLEAAGGPDSRIPPEVFWLYAWLFADHRPSKDIESTSATAHVRVKVPTSRLAVSFRAGQGFPHREALLRTVGFHQYEGPFGFLECVDTPVPWEWK